MAWTSQRVDFNTQEFYKIIEQMGYTVTWERATACPCIRVNESGQPDFNCPLCKGKGKFWHSSQTIKGIMTNFNEEARYNTNGEIMAGTSYFTTHGLNKLGFWDRVTNLHSYIRYSEIVEKGDSGQLDSLRFDPIDISVLRTVSKEYIKDVDYTIESYSIKWLPNGNEPRRSEMYSVDYTTHPRWIVIDLVNVLRDTYVKSKRAGVSFEILPVRAVVRLEFFVIQ